MIGKKLRVDSWFRVGFTAIFSGQEMEVMQVELRPTGEVAGMLARLIETLEIRGQEQCGWSTAEMAVYDRLLLRLPDGQVRWAGVYTLVKHCSVLD